MKYTRKELIDIYRLANKLHFDDFYALKSQESEVSEGVKSKCCDYPVVNGRCERCLTIQPSEEGKGAEDELKKFTRILDVSCIENLASLTSNEKHTVYDAFKIYLSQSLPAKSVTDEDIQNEAFNRARELNIKGNGQRVSFYNGFIEGTKVILNGQIPKK